MGPLPGPRPRPPEGRLRQPVVVDLRNIYRPDEMARHGFTYVSVGRPAIRHPHDGDRLRGGVQQPCPGTRASRPSSRDGRAMPPPIGRSGSAAHRNAAYGPGERQDIDIFAPDAPQDGATVLFIHGGYWQALDRSFFSHLARGLNAHGLTVAIPSYDLCPRCAWARSSTKCAKPAGPSRPRPARRRRPLGGRSPRRLPPGDRLGFRRPARGTRGPCLRHIGPLRSEAPRPDVREPGARPLGA